MIFWERAFMGKILLFYKYVSIEYPKRILKWQQKICADLKLRGRIILATEGINGTVGGDEAAINCYIAIMRKHPLFSDIDFKEDVGGADCFPRMEIKVKNEIVHLGIDPKELTIKDTGSHVSPEQAHKLMDEKSPDLVVLDARNNFESRIGTFTNSITPDIDHFRQLPQFIDENVELFKDKRVLMACTGGVRCERASAYLKSKGVAKEVMQVEGGIVRYAEKYPDGFFRGKNYVFDGRIAVQITDDVLTKCDICQTKCDDYTNCSNAECNKKFIACGQCIITLENCCSKECQYLIATGRVKVRPIFVKVSPPSSAAV
jgi:predicted sulfurtransferase